ncbi:hypothetical protein OE88DRAFT_1642919 [Heliocybe sulcata]|uniref:Uncharacterized protein n=1 Tax=Heliocybe sulcata TaxID=5364 RepID=A0A5C3NBW9_9AGAM|nr:hypothetical protein OE88DRAFT_1642919 [Heliocybe sulcata]
MADLEYTNNISEVKCHIGNKLGAGEKVCAMLEADQNWMPIWRQNTSGWMSVLHNKMILHIYKDKMPRDLMETNWAEDHSPWQIWVLQPQFIVWVGLFSRLDVTRSSIPVVHEGNRFMLELGLRENWQTLEMQIHNYMQLQTWTGLYHLGISPYWYPSTFGYLRSFTSLKKLQNTVDETLTLDETRNEDLERTNNHTIPQNPWWYAAARSGESKGID